MIGEDLIQNAEERPISGMDQLIVERWGEGPVDSCLAFVLVVSLRRGKWVTQKKGKRFFCVQISSQGQNRILNRKFILLLQPPKVLYKGANIFGIVFAFL